MSKPALDNITNVIVIMFENRSFDHLLGAMPGVNGLFVNQSPNPGIYNYVNPLSPQNNAQTPFGITPGSSEQTYTTDYDHEFTAMLVDIYGPGTTGVLSGSPQNNPAPSTLSPQTNSGFVAQNQGSFSGQPNYPNQYSVMSYFEWPSMPVFHTLAQSYVVCDNWFCDMPGHTAPNRAFMHCATTGDIGICDDDKVGPTNMVNSLTIFEQIQKNGATWKMYWPGSNCDTNWLNEQVVSQRYNPDGPENQTNVTEVPIANFFTDLQNGNLPFYSFIMCWNDIWGEDTSMHPSSLVEPGEALLAKIYHAWLESPHCLNTLLVVTFDENGGIYDHVVPPGSFAPDSQNPVSYWPPDTDTYSYDFTTLGVRVPVLLISPWLSPGILGSPQGVQFQNTSILRFLQDMLPGADPRHPYHLTQRDLNAPSIASAFHYFGANAARTDVAKLKPARPIPGVTVAPTEAQLAAKPSPLIDKMSRQYLAALPGHADSGKPVTRPFASVSDMRAYAKERSDAAQAYIAAKRMAQR